MGYRPGFQYENRRLGAPLAAIVPASIISGLCGTVILMFCVLVMALASGELPFRSLDEMVMVLVAGGMAIALGTIMGAFVVAFYILIVGFPIAALLGDQLHGSIGWAVSLLSATAGAVTAFIWMWGKTDPSGIPYEWDLILPLAPFALPAAYFYRRQVISMLDTYET